MYILKSIVAKNRHIFLLTGFYRFLLENKNVKRGVLLGGGGYQKGVIGGRWLMEG